MSITLTPYSTPPTAVTGTTFQIGITGDGSATSVAIDLTENPPFSTSIESFAERISGVVSASMSGGITVTSSSVSNHILTINFGSAPASGTTYALSIIWEVTP